MLRSAKQQHQHAQDNAKGAVRCLVRHSQRPLAPCSHEDLQSLFADERAIRIYGEAAAHSLDDTDAARLRAARSAMTARLAPVCSHHALEVALVEKTSLAPDGVLPLVQFTSAEWARLNARDPRLLDGTACIQTEHGYYTMLRVPLAHSVAVREPTAQGLAASLEGWAASPLAQLRHYSGAVPAVLAHCFRRLRLACFRWHAVRASQSPRQRALCRLLDAGIVTASAARALACVSTTVISPGATIRCDVQQLARFIELPDSLRSLPDVHPVPCLTAGDGVCVNTHLLRHGRFYLCEPALLRSHFTATRHDAPQLRGLLGALDALVRRRSQHQQPAAQAHAAVPSPSPPDTATAAGRIYRELATSMDFSAVPWFDLIFDERFLAALHRHEKDIESRFFTGIYRRLAPGMLVRCRAKPKSTGSDPARRYSSWWFVGDIVKARGFYALYKRFTTRLLPGRPHHYIATNDASADISAPSLQSCFTRASRARLVNAYVAWRHAARTGGARQRNLCKVWTPAQVEAVFHSIYCTQYPTLSAWRASQQELVLGLVLWRVPAGFVPPTTPAVNHVQANSASAFSATLAAAELRTLAARVVQRCWRAKAARTRLRRRRSAFALYLHLAHLRGTSLRLGASGDHSCRSRTFLAAFSVRHAVAVLQRAFRRSLYAAPATTVQCAFRRLHARRRMQHRAALLAVSVTARHTLALGASRLVCALLTPDQPLPSYRPTSFLGTGECRSSRLHWLDLAYTASPQSPWAPPQRTRWHACVRLQRIARRRAASQQCALRGKQATAELRKSTRTGRAYVALPTIYESADESDALVAAAAVVLTDRVTAPPS